jgi:circadian clock protein KaiB
MPVKALPKPGVYALRLYIADHTPRSILALANLRKLCEKHLAGRYRLEVIDLMKNPELAKIDRILAVPTLIRKLPVPIRKFIGNLSNPERLLIDFDLLPAEANSFVMGK